MIIDTLAKISAGAAIYLVVTILILLPSLWIYDRVDRARQEKLKNKGHLINLWNILIDYRKDMPDEPVPMDEALLHLQMVLSSLGVPPPLETRTAECGCPACVDIPVDEPSM